MYQRMKGQRTLSTAVTTVTDSVYAVLYSPSFIIYTRQCTLFSTLFCILSSFPNVHTINNAMWLFFPVQVTLRITPSVLLNTLLLAMQIPDML